MNLREKRVVLAAIVRGADGTVAADNKIETIQLDNRLTGHGSAVLLVCGKKFNSSNKIGTSLVLKRNDSICVPAN